MGEENFTITSADEYQEVRKTLSRKQKPAKIMCMLMNALESYRQKRKLGWSRPWNKYDLNVFQSFKLQPERDSELLALADELLKNDIPMPASARRFAEELLAGTDKLMGFVFVHDYNPQEGRFEGATLSLGRIHNKKFRDRIDLILESPVVDGASQGFSRMRVYVDPFTEVKEPLWSSVVEKEFTPGIMELFSRLSDISWQWKDDESKVWDHWTSAYIDYFGERKEAPEATCFYAEGKSQPAVAQKKEEQAA